jgi:hypothetical protein
MAHEANRGREGTWATRVDGFVQGQRGLDNTHKHMKILFEAKK